MRVNREKCIENIKNNIQEIRQHMDHLSEKEINILYEKLQDVFLFYGYKNVGNNFLERYFRSDNAIEKEPNQEALESVTNSILFRLKYRHKSTG
ncbi:MAG: hypothetical protein ACNS60_16690 [Candidatus Cyclobacteriaceae bacterium M2_1C_046]